MFRVFLQAWPPLPPPVLPPNSADLTIVGAAIAGAAAIIGGLVSGFFQYVRERWNRPVLQLDFPKEEADKIKAKQTPGADLILGIFVRARVRNNGRRDVAHGCRIYLTAIGEVQQGGATIPTEYSDSLPLQWAGGDREERDVPRGVEFYADIVSFPPINPKWMIGVKLFASYSNLADFRGTYRFRIVATAKNADPTSFQIDVTYNGDWRGVRVVPVSEKGSNG